MIILGYLATAIFATFLTARLMSDRGFDRFDILSASAAMFWLWPLMAPLGLLGWGISSYLDKYENKS